MIYEEVKATGNYVVLKAERREEKKEVTTKSGLILSGENAKENFSGQKVNALGGKVLIKTPVIISIGPKVDKALIGIEIGDKVVVNDYDAHSFTDDTGAIWTVCQDKSIQCVLKEKEEE